ncbi:MAG: hypothetical protein K9H11_21325 [Rhodospirillum sp.]|nr:hypothetical protein [Rhodospirillum sp.]
MGATIQDHGIRGAGSVGLDVAPGWGTRDTMMKKVCFFGDSFTYGIGDETGHGWVGRLAGAEAGEGRAFSAFNLGLPQETTPRLMERWRSEADRRVEGLAVQSVGLVFCFGLDDMADVNDEGIRIDLPQSMAVAERLVGEAATLYPCLWIGPPPARSSEPFLTDRGDMVRYRKERLGALDLAYRRIAEDLRVPYLDLHGNPKVDAAFRRAPRIDGTVHGVVADQVRGWLSWRRWFDVHLSSPPPGAKAAKSEFQPLRMTGGLLG